MKVLYFAQASSLAACTVEQWDITQHLSQDEFWTEAIRRHPALSEIRDHCRIASQMRYLTPEDFIAPDSETAIIPPVSGG